MEKLVVCKKFKFDAAHRLPDYNGPCCNLHGHSFVLEVEIEGSADGKTGMILDFNLLKQVVQEKVISKLDHTLLNNIEENPTAEHLLWWIRKELKDSILDQDYSLSRLRLYETDTSYAEWQND